jgi:hypothetical protein
MRDAVEDGAVVVAHVGRAVRARFEVRARCEHGEIEAVPFAQPPIRSADRFEPFLMTHCDSTHHFPVVERAERADPGVAAERRERLADAHHVGLGHAHVQCAPLIDNGNPGLEPARRSEIGIDRGNPRIPGKHLHGLRDDLACGVLLCAIQTRQQGSVV